MKHHVIHPLVVRLMGVVAAIFDRQVMRGEAPRLSPGAAARYYVITGRGPTGIAAAKRAARKRRNVIRNRRAHRG